MLHSNRARVRMLLDEPDPQGAAADAHAACVLCPDWPKPRHRLAEAQLALGKERTTTRDEHLEMNITEKTFSSRVTGEASMHG